MSHGSAIHPPLLEWVRSKRRSRKHYKPWRRLFLFTGQTLQVRGLDVKNTYGKKCQTDQNPLLVALAWANAICFSSNEPVSALDSRHTHMSPSRKAIEKSTSNAQGPLRKTARKTITCFLQLRCVRANCSRFVLRMLNRWNTFFVVS